METPEARSFVTSSGELWLFPDSGQVRGGDLYKITTSVPCNAESGLRFNVSSTHFHHKSIESIFYQDDLSFCFIDSDKNLYLYDTWRQAKVFIRNIGSLLQKYGPVTGVAPFYDDFMIAFRTNGLVRLNAADSYAEEIIDRNLRIFCLYKDPVQGILWIGVDGKGAMMYMKRHSIATNVMMQSLSPNFTRQVRSVMTDRHGDLWFGTKGDGLIRIKQYAEGMNAEKAVVFSPGKRQTAREYTREDTEFTVFSLKQSEYMDGFWVGSGQTGLFYCLFDDPQLRHLEVRRGRQPNEVHGIYEADDTTLYVATANSGFRRLTLDKSNGKIAVKDQKHYRFFHDQQEINTFFDLVPEGDTILWLGSRERGLVRFEIGTENYWVYSLKEMLNRAVDDVLCVCKTKNGDMFVGTTAGLVRLKFDGRKAEAWYTGREQGLLNDMIHGILEDANGFLWLSTNKGLIKYNPANGSSHAYYYSGGVQIGEFSDDAYYKCRYSERLFFGGMDGLLYIDKTNSETHEYYPDILLRGLSFNRERVNPADYYEADRTVLRFRYTDEFALTFTAPDFISGADIEYSWMLDGYDEKWSSFGMLHEASYANIPAGNYVFRIRYRKDIFDTDFKTLSIPLRIDPLWYQTAVFRILLALLAVAAAFYLISMLCRSIRHKRILNKLLKSESGNVLDAGAAYRSHEVVTGLTSIYRVCETLRSEGVTYQQRCDVAESVRETVMALLLPSDVFHPSGGGLPPSAHFVLAGNIYLKEISDEVMYLLMKKGVDLSNIEADIPDDFCFSVYKNAFRVFFNYVYLFAGGVRRFSVSVSESEGMMTLTFKSSRNVLNRLHESLAGGVYTPPPTMVLKNPDEIFNMQLLHGFVVNIMEQLQPIIAYSEIESELSLSFLPVAVAEPSADKKVVLLLEDHDEMCWFVNGILSAEYVVHQVRSIQQAVEFMESSCPAVFLVDMAMYADTEDTFMEFINRSGSLLARTAFVPMLTWTASSSIQRNLILHADAFIVLPYDIIFLREIVHKALYGRNGGGGKLIYVDGLTENIANLFTCTISEQVEFVRRMVAIIEENLDRENLGSSFIAEQLAMSPRQFYRKFKEISNYSPTELIKNYRLEKAAVLLLDPGLSIKDVMAEIGIASRSYLYREFTNKFGMTPGDYRNIHAGKASS